MQQSATPATTQSQSSLKIYLRLLGYLRPFIGFFVVSIIGYLIFASSQPMLAAVLKYFVDGLAASPEATRHSLPLIGRVELMYGIPILLVLIIVWRSVGSFLGNYYLARVSLGLINDLRIALFNSLLRLPNRYFDQQSSCLFYTSSIQVAHPECTQRCRCARNENRYPCRANRSRIE